MCLLISELELHRNPNWMLSIRITSKHFIFLKSFQFLQNAAEYDSMNILFPFEFL